MNPNRYIWAKLRGRKLKPTDNGPTWIIGGILVLIGLIILILFGD